MLLSLGSQTFALYLLGHGSTYGSLTYSENRVQDDGSLSL